MSKQVIFGNGCTELQHLKLLKKIESLEYENKQLNRIVIRISKIVNKPLRQLVK